MNFLGLAALLYVIFGIIVIYVAAKIAIGLIKVILRALDRLLDD